MGSFISLLISVYLLLVNTIIMFNAGHRHTHSHTHSQVSQSASLHVFMRSEETGEPEGNLCGYGEHAKFYPL